MSDIDKAVEKFFNDDQKITLKTLFEEVEKAIDLFNIEPITEDAIKGGSRFSYSIAIPKMVPTEAWGDPTSQDRLAIKKIFEATTGGADIKENIQSINGFLDPEKVATLRKSKRKRSSTRILRMMMIIEALQATLNDYNEASAGFVFEAFMAALTGGKQIAGRIGGTLPIEDFVTAADESVSLKLLSPDTDIHGSLTNLIDYLFIRGGTGEPNIKYMIAYKLVVQGEVERLQIFDFIIGRENLVEVMIASKNQKLFGERSSDLQQAIKIFMTNPTEGQAALARVLVADWIPHPDWINPETGIENEKSKRKGKYIRNPNDPGIPGYSKNGMFYKNYKADEPVGARVSGVHEDGRLCIEYEVKMDGDKIVKVLDKKIDKDGNPVYIMDSPKDEQGNYTDPDMARANRKKCADIERALKLQKGGYAILTKKAPTIAQRYQQRQDEPVDSEPESMEESFHAREKRLMKLETQQALLEGKGSATDAGTQWGISRAQMANMNDLINTDSHGEVNLSQERIDKLTEEYIKELGDSLVELLEKTKKFTENIGTYFSAKDRSEGTRAADAAAVQSGEIATTLKDDPLKAEPE